MNISGRGFRANAAVTGTLAVAATTSPVSGTYALSGGDYERNLKVGAGSRVPTRSLRVVNDSAYSSTGTGPWFEAAFPAAGTDLGSVLRSIKTVKDLGVETKDGQQLHHLVATDVALPPAVLGLTDKTIKDVTGTLDFWVTDEGMPKIVSATGNWTQASGKDPAAPATLNAEFALSNVGGTVDLPAPDQIWRRVKSKKYHYTMAAPTDWEYQKAHAKRADWFVGPEYATVFASNAPDHGFSLNSWTQGVIRVAPRVSGVKGFKLMSNKPAILAGARARRIEFKDTFKGGKEYSIIELADHGGKMYEVGYTSSKPLTTADRALFDQFLSTFQF